MKLKKSFSASLLILFSIIFSSCMSTSFDIPVPGQGDVKMININQEYLNIGDTYFKLEDYRNASNYYQKAMQNRKTYWNAYYKLAKCYAYLSDWNNALPMYKTILKRDPENASIKASIAYIYSMQGEFNKAEDLYTELISTQSENQSYLENYLAILLANESKLKQNKQTYEKYFAELQENFPESKNISILQEKYNQLKETLKLDDESKDIEIEEEAETSEKESFEENAETTESN